jgi:hypothetical protein
MPTYGLTQPPVLLSLSASLLSQVLTSICLIQPLVLLSL